MHVVSSTGQSMAVMKCVIFLRERKSLCFKQMHSNLNRKVWMRIKTNQTLLWTNTIEWDSGKEISSARLDFNKLLSTDWGWMLDGSVSRFHLDSDLFVTKMTSLSPTSLAQTHSEKKIALLIFPVHAHKNNLIRLCKVLSTINVERRASKIGKECSGQSWCRVC